MPTHCIYCNKALKGRADKKFCDADCRNAYNNQKNTDVNKIMRNINRVLRKNRRILDTILKNNPEETVKIHKDFLVQEGFNFQYFTHIYTTQKGKQYYFIYDLAYLPLTNDWFLIVHRKQ